MRYRVLGKTGIAVSVVGIGTWQLSGLWDKKFSQSEVDAIFAAGRERGVNLVDTAECYGHHDSERFIGAAIAGERDKWVVATKFGHNQGNDLGDENYRPEQVQIQLEESLRALQTDYIDVYQMHSAADNFFNNDELWTMLDKQVQAGKVRYLGNSVFMADMKSQLQKSSEYGISVIQVAYNVVNRKAEETVFPQAREQGLGVICRTPLASGFLSGKYEPGQVFPSNDVRSMRPQDGVDKEIARARKAIERRPEGMDAATWAAAWCLEQSCVTAVIPGIKSVAQMEAAAHAGEVFL